MLAEDNEFPYVTMAEQASDVATPGAGLWRIYPKSDGLYLIDDAGTVVGPLGAGGGGGGGDASWTNATLTNSWVTFGAPYLTPGYRKDASGVVHLRGVVKSGTSATSALTLPTGYRPAGKASFRTLAPVTDEQIDVNTDGTVVISTSSNAYAGLDGISFYTD